MCCCWSVTKMQWIQDNSENSKKSSHINLSLILFHRSIKCCLRIVSFVYTIQWEWSQYLKFLKLAKWQNPVSNLKHPTSHLRWKLAHQHLHFLWSCKGEVQLQKQKNADAFCMKEKKKRIMKSVWQFKKNEIISHSVCIYYMHILWYLLWGTSTGIS